MTTSSIVARARQIIEDTKTPYRWADEKLNDYVQTAVWRLNALAPHTRYVGANIVDFIDVSGFSTGAVLPISDRYGEALSLYVAYLAYFNDATDTVNGERAAACLQRAEGLMV